MALHVHVPSLATTLEQYPIALSAVQHNALFACTAMLPNVMLPFTDKLALGLDVLMPTLPEVAFTVNFPSPASKVVAGLVVPIPT
jgi:hypothetical protein